MIRYEKTELTRSLDLGRFDAWKVQAAHIDPDRPLVLFDFEPHRVYSPLEHSELPHAFACVISIGIDDRPETDSYDAEALKHFVSTFGRLGWVEAKRNAQQGDHLIFETQDLVAAALNEFGRINAAADRERHRMMTHFAEPIRWVVGHASVVWWCLRAAEALQVSQKRARESACEWIAERVPDQDGQLPILVARRRPGGFSCSDYVGACLAETLTGKVQWVRRRVDYLGNGTLRSL